MLDAFFADESFSESLKTRLQLTDEQVTKLKELAHSETAKLNEANAGNAGTADNVRAKRRRHDASEDPGIDPEIHQDPPVDVTLNYRDAHDGPLGGPSRTAG